jgi:hypothetical protein
MALVNPNIAMSFRAPEIQQPNMLADYAAIQQIQGGRQAQEMNALKMQEAQAALQERNALRQLNPAAADYENQLFRVNPTLGIAYRKERSAADASAAQIAASQAAAAKSAFDLKAAQRKFGDDLKRGLSSNPSDENIIAFGQDAILQGLYTPDQVKSTVSQLLSLNPADRVRILSQAGASVSELQPKLSVGPTGIVQTPAFGGPATVVQGTDAAFQMTPAQIAANKVAQGQLAVSQGQLSATQQRLAFDKEKATQPVFNAQAGGFVAPPTKENPQGIFIPATKIQAAKDQSAAVRALKSAGYNVETGEDTISKLIEKSTSGGLQAGSAAALAFFGKSTEGRKAIAALEGTANQIATDLAGGKLGAGISNTDREFIVGALGDVANPMKTAEERLSGWTAAKNRMMLTGLIPPPKTAGAAAAGVDTNNPLLK